MKILSAEQTRQADAATIQRASITSVELMEQAATEFVRALIESFAPFRHPVYVFCGPGNNGGDGLAIARLLTEPADEVLVFTVQAQDQVSDDFATNRDRWTADHTLRNITQASDIPPLPTGALIVDALFGSGLSRPAEGVFAEVIDAINAAEATVVAVDIPSGLFADQATPPEAAVVRADRTFTFQLPKLTFLLPGSQSYVGLWRMLNIDLDADFIRQVATDYHYTDAAAVRGVRQRRRPSSHKGTYGKVLLIAGSYGKVGAAVLCARACKRGGVGLLTLHVPECGYTVLQTAVPEAMVLVDNDTHRVSSIDPEVLSGYDTVGIGPGLGTDEATVRALQKLLPSLRERDISLVMDADALNICGQHRRMLRQLPSRTILTPHPKEFERLTQPAQNDFHRLELLQEFCRTYEVHVVLKGNHTAVGAPDGSIYFNSTGNPGMATGGSGDVLTGLLTALLAQGYEPLVAARLGVYLHGLAGDLAIEVQSVESLTALDLVAYFGPAFRQLDA